MTPRANVQAVARVLNASGFLRATRHGPGFRTDGRNADSITIEGVDVAGYHLALVAAGYVARLAGTRVVVLRATVEESSVDRKGAK